MKKNKDKDREKERDYERLVEQESLILAATEMLEGLIEENEDNRKELADKLGRSKGFVTQVLAGDRNMTLRTLSDFAFALEHRVKVAAAPLVEYGDGGEADGDEGRVMARVFSGTGEQIGHARDEQAGEDSRRPLAAESAGAYGAAIYTRYLNARSEGDWGERLLWENASAETSSGIEKVAG